jgi:Inovirus Coat protein B
VLGCASQLNRLIFTYLKVRAMMLFSLVVYFFGLAFLFASFPASAAPIDVSTIEVFILENGEPIGMLGGAVLLIGVLLWSYKAVLLALR